MTKLIERILKRPIIKMLLEEYLIEKSPLLSNYVKRISEITGLSEDIVKRSKPVRNYVKKILGDN